LNSPFSSIIDDPLPSSGVYRPRVLVVDDQPINVQLLKRKLEREGMEVFTAENGRECLSVVERESPELILLDVMMPEMDGIEVCQELKRREGTRSIPVIFITARNSKEGKIEGLGAGAVDYITKPIDLDETLARVQTQLRFLAVNRSNVELQRRLGESRRNAAMGAITQGIAHNLNNLLGVVVGYLDLVKAFAAQPEVAHKNLMKMEAGINRMVGIIRQLSSISVQSRFPVTSTNLPRVLDNALKRFRAEYPAPTASIDLRNEAEIVAFDGNMEVLEDVICKLMMNAFESYGIDWTAERPIELVVSRGTREGVATLEFAILDRGRGLDPEVRDHIFDPFVSTKHTVGVGMGLTVARHSMRGLGGDVDLFSRSDGGAEARFYLPIKRSPQ
jgi:two-component system, sensor histidine kinase and response regulator